MATITSPRAQSPATLSRITSPTIPSAGGTPTSSVRPSIDLPSTSVIPTSGAAQGNQRRNRAALRDYYNLKAKAATSPARAGSVTSLNSESTVTSGGTLTTNNEPSTSDASLATQLDDPSFDADKYIAELLRTSTLRDILRTESTLVSEIRNLDGERKALVYDNYSKLIKAVSTIGEMQKGMQEQPGSSGTGLDAIKGLPEKLEKLMGSVEAMKVARDTKGLDDNANKTQRDERRRRQLVRWVLDSPPRLEGLIERGDRKQAEEEWSRVQELLEKWKGVEGVDDVKRSCSQIMKEPPQQQEQEQEHEDTRKPED